MTKRDELRDQIESAIFSRRGPIEPLVEQKILPMIDAYVAERLAERQEAIAKAIEARSPSVVDNMGDQWERDTALFHARIARDFGEETSDAASS